MSAAVEFQCDRVAATPDNPVEVRCPNVTTAPDQETAEAAGWLFRNYGPRVGRKTYCPDCALAEWVASTATGRGQ